jgi:pyruvate,water dikinase
MWVMMNKVKSFVWSGNICGRVYSNISRRVSAIAALTGWDTRRIMGLLGDMFGREALLARF